MTNRIIRAPGYHMTEYDPDKRLAPRPATTLDEIKVGIRDNKFARVAKADKNRLCAQAKTRGYKWSWIKDGRYYIVKLVVK